MKSLSLLVGLLLAFVYTGACLADEDKASSQRSAEVKERHQQADAEAELSPMAILVNSVDVCDTN